MNKLTKIAMLMAATALAAGCVEGNRERVKAIDLSYLDTTLTSTSTRREDGRRTTRSNRNMRASAHSTI